MFTCVCFLFTFVLVLQSRMDSGNQWNGNYYGKHGYGNNVPLGQDPNMYTSGAGYGAPTNGYGNH